MCAGCVSDSSDLQTTKPFNGCDLLTVCRTKLTIMFGMWKWFSSEARDSYDFQSYPNLTLKFLIPGTEWCVHVFVETVLNWIVILWSLETMENRP